MKVAPKIAMALAGGGPLGAIYEIGVLCALEESLTGIDLNRLHHYVGVSAGGFIAAALANGMTPRALCDAFIENTADEGEVFDPAWMMQPAYAEYARRGALLPLKLMTAMWQVTWGQKSWLRAAESLAPTLPTGLFSNEAIHTHLSRLFKRTGRTNDFRKLRTRLTLVATHLDTAQAALFGSPGWDHIPISKAVQASAALPGLFPPVEIEGQHYVDGALKKTMHASVALDAGVDLLICLNPLVPFDGSATGLGKIGRIADGGLPAVLSQSMRSMIHSRMELGMKHYESAYPDTDIVLLEPDHHDPELYLANTFSYAQRRHLAEHAYQQTRSMLRTDAAGIAKKLARHGVRMNHVVLSDAGRRLVRPARAHSPVSRSLENLHLSLNHLANLLDATAPVRKRRELR